MKSLKKPELIITVILALWINHLYVVRPILGESDFYDAVYAVFGNWDEAERLFPEYLTHNFSHALFLIVIVCLSYLIFTALDKRKKWQWSLVIIILGPFLLGLILSLQDNLTFSSLEIRFPLQTAHLERLSGFQHLIFRNLTEAYCLVSFTASVIFLSSYLQKGNDMRTKLQLLTQRFWLINYLFYFLAYILFMTLLQGYDIYDLSQVLFILIGACLVLTFLSSTFFIVISNHWPSKGALTNHIAKCSIIFLGILAMVFYLQSHSLSRIYFGDIFLRVTLQFYLFSLITILVLVGWNIALFTEDIFGFKSKLKLEQAISTLSSELSFLKMQINPHFLFNSLNTVYGLALEEKSPKSAEGIQKLSDMMRFMLQENTAERIPLQSEIKYINDYIDFQKLRVNEQKNVKIDVVLASNCNGEIAPMLLIPMIENAFKHGISLDKSSWITINLECNQNEVHLNIRNSMHQKIGLNSDERGIGLDNVRQRLKILYPDKHMFQLFEDEEKFEANIKVTLT